MLPSCYLNNVLEMDIITSVGDLFKWVTEHIFWASNSTSWICGWKKVFTTLFGFPYLFTFMLDCWKKGISHNCFNIVDCQWKDFGGLFKVLDSMKWMFPSFYNLWLSPMVVETCSRLKHNCNICYIFQSAKRKEILSHVKFIHQFPI